MGQRLVISIIKDEKRIAALYYHWSAYSVSALYETRHVINCLSTLEPEDDIRLKLIRFVEERGGGIASCDNREHARIQAMYPKETFKTEGYSRNNGLIALSEEGMNDLYSWSEGDVDINLDDNTVYNYVTFEEDLDRIKQWRDDITCMEDIPEYTNHFVVFPIEEIDEAVEEVENAPNIFRYGDTIYSLVA